MRMFFQFVAVLMLAALGGGLALVGAPADAQTEIAETRTVALDAGWTLAGWTGPDTPLADAIADIVDVTEAAAAFDAVPQSFRSWNASGPGFLNSLDTLFQGQAVWVLVSAPVDWVQPVVAEPGPLALRRGFNLITWTGPSGLDPASAFAGLGGDLSAAFAFDPATESFSSYGPARPSFINDLDPITYGDGFWALTGTATLWDQPAAPAPFSRTLPGGSVTLTIPRGALPAGVDPASIQIADITQTPAFAAVADQAEGVVVGLDLQPSGLQFALPVTVTATVPSVAGSELFALLSVGDQLELITDLTRVASTAETVTVAATIDHFSIYWIVIAPTLVTAENQNVGPIAVGTRFDAAITTTLNAGFDGPVTAFRDTIDESGDEMTEILEIQIRIATDPNRRWRLLSPDPFRPLEGAVTPVGRVRRIPSIAVPSLPIETSQTFSCDGPGDFLILYLDDALVPLAALVGPLHRVSERRPFVRVPDVDAFVRGTCTALPGTLSFLTLGVTGQLVGQIPLGEDFELLIHDEQNPLPPRFPLTITITRTQFTSSGDEVDVRTFVLEGNAAVVCSDPNEPHWCSLRIGAISEVFDRVEISVTDKDGNPVAFSGLGSR